MTREELGELFLAHLYELAEKAPHPNFLFSVNEFAPKLGITSREEIQKAIDYLGDRGFIILASLDSFGGISAGITIEGSVFVEKGGETGIIRRYRENPQRSNITAFAPDPPSVDSERTGTVSEERQDFFSAPRTVEAIFEDIEDILKRDDTAAAEVKKDLFSDLATLKIQMERHVKNQQIIQIILGNLSRIPSVSPLVTALRCIMKGYFR
ncbi:MAG TPA: hypothetical protein VLZ03_02105 [Thermodesulfobacteriota bacterium]|nr:hypothetical protein [Thermodesulfobacteriota bacterium]